MNGGRRGRRVMVGTSAALLGRLVVYRRVVNCRDGGGCLIPIERDGGYDAGCTRARFLVGEPRRRWRVGTLAVGRVEGARACGRYKRSSSRSRWQLGSATILVSVTSRNAHKPKRNFSFMTRAIDLLLQKKDRKRSRRLARRTANCEEAR